MQTLGKGFLVKRMYVEAGIILCECPDGWFFGYGQGAVRVTGLGQINMIANDEIRAACAAWLEGAEARAAEQAARQAAQPAQAVQAAPTSLSVLVNSLSPEAQHGLTAVIAEYLSRQGTPAPPVPGDSTAATVVPGGTLVDMPGGGKKFVPDDIAPEDLDKPLEDETAGPPAAPAWACQYCQTPFDTKLKRDGHLRWCKTRLAQRDVVTA